jgi:hypothetical protein
VILLDSSGLNPVVAKRENDIDSKSTKNGKNTDKGVRKHAGK